VKHSVDTVFVQPDSGFFDGVAVGYTKDGDGAGCVDHGCILHGRAPALVD